MPTIDQTQAERRRRDNALYALANAAESVGERLSDLSQDPLGQVPTIVQQAITDLQAALAHSLDTSLR